VEDLLCQMRVRQILFEIEEDKMKANVNCERQYSPDRALNIISQEMEKLSLSVKYKSVGNSIKTYQCFITDNDKTFIGCGKGIGMQSKVSATYEAFEHYYCYRRLTDQNHSEIKFLSIADVSNSKDLITHNKLPAAFLSNEAIKFPWLTYKSFISEEIYLHPLFLVEPRYAQNAQFPEDVFDYSPYAWLSSDSGTASGTSFTEAAIHAINECIERDATSVFLAKVFMKEKPLHLILKRSLPTYLQEYIKNIENETQDDLAIIDITSEFNIPTFCVSFTHQKNTLIQPKGFGTSLNKTYAIERALLEALQPLHLRTKTLEQFERDTVERFEPYPLLQKAAIADVKLVMDKNQYIEKSFSSLEYANLSLSLDDQLNYLVNVCQSKGFIPYFTMISNKDSNITCVKVLIPGLDNFYTIQAGIFTLPSQRTIEFAHKN
jgi:ribosomal protein S12 methylthiotransferase accessory factor